MNIPERIWATQKALKVAGVSVRQFCFRADIAPKTWRRWRTGVNLPHMAKWLQAEATLAAIQEERRESRLARRKARQKAAIQATKPQP